LGKAANVRDPPGQIQVKTELSAAWTLDDRAPVIGDWARGKTSDATLPWLCEGYRAAARKLERVEAIRHLFDLDRDE